MKPPFNIKIAEDCPGTLRAVLHRFLPDFVVRALRVLHYKACILIVLCMLLPGYGDNYVTYAVGGFAAYSTGKALITNLAVKKREMISGSAPDADQATNGTGPGKTGITDGSLW